MMILLVGGEEEGWPSIIQPPTITVTICLVIG